jgi:hypothetical protein
MFVFSEMQTYKKSGLLLPMEQERRIGGNIGAVEGDG